VCFYGQCKKKEKKRQKRGQRASVPWPRLCCCLVDAVIVHCRYTVANPLLNFHVYIFLFFMKKIIYVVYLIFFCNLNILKCKLKIYIYK